MSLDAPFFRRYTFSMEQYRIFIAIELENDIRNKINNILAKLREKIPSGIRWVSINNIHLTLKFIGDFPINRIADLQKSLESAAAPVPEFQVGFSRLGAFPGFTNPRVIWIGVEQNLELTNLAAACDSVTKTYGVPAEDRRFSPHLTLGRVSDHLQSVTVSEIGEILSAEKVGSLGVQSASSICLIRSQLSATGPIYSLLARLPLKKA